MNLRPKQVCLLLVASLALTRAQSADPSLPNTNINEIDDKIPEKPEPRQIGAVMPYTWLQPGQGMGQAMAQVAQSAPAISSWGSSSPSWWSSLGSGQSFLSLFKPNVIGGRRSSLTSRLRNLMNALFYRRETSTPYLTSGSNSMYSYRQPPFGFSSSFPTSSQLASALGNQNLYGQASFNRPVVLPSFGSSPTDNWSNYKQYASGSNLPTGWASGSSGSGSGSSSGALWQSGSSSGSGSQYSALGSSSYPTYSSGSGSSNSGYQASASNLFPQTSYQRSSISTYSKPQPSASTSVSSSVSVSSSSNSASSSNPKQVPFQS